MATIVSWLLCICFFFFNDTATTEIYTYRHTLSLHDALPIYAVHPINITKNEQFVPAFLKISPNNKIPAIVDADGPGGQPISLFESGAILIYLAEKSGRLLPQAARARLEALQWLMWQMGGFGPMLGQAHHFRRSAKEQVPYAAERHPNETRRHSRALATRLGASVYLSA